MEVNWNYQKEAKGNELNHVAKTIVIESQKDLKKENNNTNNNNIRVVYTQKNKLIN